MALLQAELQNQSIPVRTLHLNTRLLKYVKYKTYVDLAGYWGLNEFVFTELLSPGEDDAQIAALADRCAAMRETEFQGRPYPTPAALLEMLLRFRGDVALDYLSECAEEVLKHEPTMVGLTCMFDQTLASVALAKLVKARSPETMIVLGGYALEGEPGDEVIRAFPWIDAISRGDGEPVIDALARASVSEVALSEIPGVQTRKGRGRPRVYVDLGASADPVYDDWFTAIAELEQETGIRIVPGALPVESSRGCWWGQHHHCVFCGIDGDTLKFRSKPAERTLDMLEAIRDLYGEHPLRFSDYILPHEYLKELLPKLAMIQPRFRLHCEIKANQTREAVASLARAGFEEVQPGIESFSSEVLQLMNKGVTEIQNVALLKYGYLERIVVHYNFIYGIPGESPEAYRSLLEKVPRLYHLMPPVSRTEAIVTRFAPMQEDPARSGSSEAPVHHRCYDVLFSQSFLNRSGFRLDGYAYYFEPYKEFADEMAQLYVQCVMQMNHWKRLHRDRRVTFAFTDDGSRITFEDSRFSETPAIVCLDGIHRAAYLACDAAPVNVDAAARHLLDSGQASSEVEVESAYRDLDQARMVWRDGKRIIGLAVPKEVADRHLATGWRERWTAIYK